jgi:hypothetical protein
MGADRKTQAERIVWRDAEGKALTTPLHSFEHFRPD